MESKTKIRISIFFVIILCVSSFCAGRFIRFKRISGTSQQLVDGIILERETIDRIADELNIESNSIKSAAQLGRAIEDGIRTIREANEVGQVCTNAIVRSIEDDRELIESLHGSVSGYLSATDYALNVAIKRAEFYERIISAYDEATRNSREDTEEPE